MILVLYELKDYENLKEILQIAKHFGIEVWVVQRKRSDLNYEDLKKIYDFNLCYSFDEVVEKFKHKKFVFLETYGNKYIFEEKLSEDYVYVLGAEDYGVPLHEIEKVKNKIVLKIPMKVPGSYNVVSSLAMLLCEIY